MPSPRQTRNKSNYYRDGHIPAVALTVQVPHPVRRDDIHGAWRIVAGAEAPAICWGDRDKYWAWLHDLDTDALGSVLDAFASAVANRRTPGGR